MKRKAEDSARITEPKKQATDLSNALTDFRQGLFNGPEIQRYTDDYARSEPYKHAVVSNIIEDGLLRKVRSEVIENIHFTTKETDIYKIYQSGDLANLDGLPVSALDKFPALLKLRDALYSHEFRNWISTVSGSGPLSGTKTDMAVNVYVPGCHLLCHDDVIGTRRVSYILYLTDPDKPWKAQWGGALRLYPTEKVTGEDGKIMNLPSPEWSKVIPPAWNQLSFFAVQPGESFHDVEEVYHHGIDVDADGDGGRSRIAISGWFHIPQEGEESFEPGLEGRLAEQSSRQQLQGKVDRFDAPQQIWSALEDAKMENKEQPLELSEAELEFLIRFMTPNYLTPDTVEELNELFSEESVLQLTNVLSDKFSASLKTAFEVLTTEELKFSTSQPPHKHRFQYVQPQDEINRSTNPILQVLNELLPSAAFRKWLSLVTGLTLKRCSVLLRRFRSGLDYQLAQGYENEDPQLEFTLCVTPTLGWNTEEQDTSEGNGTTITSNPDSRDASGGYELYLAGDDPADEDEDGDGIDVSKTVASSTGAGQRRPAKSARADPAVYREAGDDDDDGILFSNPADWNTLSIVLRDQGTLKFVKYVSRSAPGDRFDFTGCVEVEPMDEE